MDWLKRIPDYARDTAADLGTQVHAMAEALGRGEPVTVDESLRPYLAAYRRDFLDVFAPRFLAVEAMVCSERYAYGGTADAFVEIAGETWLLDYKTGSAVYPDSALQLAGLARAQFIGYPGDPVQYPVPFATRFGILHVRPEGATPVSGDGGPGDRGGLPRCPPPVWLGPGPGEERHRGAAHTGLPVRGRLTISSTPSALLRLVLPCSAAIRLPGRGALPGRTRSPRPCGPTSGRGTRAASSPPSGSPIPVSGALELDHVRASGGLGLRSRSTPDNLVLLCPAAHRIKTLAGRRWRPVLLAWIERAERDGG